MSVQVIKRKTGKGRSYRVRYTDHLGKMQSEDYEVLADAATRDEDIRQAKQRREPIPRRGRGDASETFGTFAYGTWWPQCVEAQKMVPKTCERYKTFLDKHLLPRIGDEPIAYIDVARVLEVRAELVKDAPSYTAARALKLLRQVLHFAVLSGRLSSNPADVLRAKGMLPAQGRKREIRPLLPPEVEAIRRAMLARQTPHALRDATLVSVLGYAGLRPSEALRLTWENVGAEQLRIVTSKTGRPRTVPKLVKQLMSDLGDWRAACGDTSPKALVFPDEDGRSWSVTAYGNWRNRAWKDCAPAANVIYDLRHGYSLSLAREGVQVADAAKRMGHKPATHLQHYEHFFDELREQKREPLEAAVKKCRISAASCATEGYEPVAQAA